MVVESIVVATVGYWLTGRYTAAHTIAEYLALLCSKGDQHGEHLGVIGMRPRCGHMPKALSGRVDIVDVTVENEKCAQEVHIAAFDCHHHR